MTIPSLHQTPGPVRPGPGRRRPGVLPGVLALIWLAAFILPASRPNLSGGQYLGAAILAVAAGGAGLLGAGALRRRYADSSRVGLIATPIIATALVTALLGAASQALGGVSPVLGDALAWTAGLGLLLMVLALAPLPGSDGSRIVLAAAARRRGQPAAEALLARVTRGFGLISLVAGAALFAFVDVGFGIMALLLGYVCLTTGRVAGARRRLLESIDGLTAADVVVRSAPLPSWKSLDDAVTEHPFPTGAAAVPVVDWSGAPAGALLARAADSAMGTDHGDSRVSALAVPPQLVPTVPVDVPARELVDLLAGTAGGVVVVTEDGRPVGAVTAEALQAAGRTGRLRGRRSPDRSA